MNLAVTGLPPSGDRRWPWNQHTGNHPHRNVGHIVIGAPSIRPTRRIWGWIAVGIMGEHGEALLVGGSRGWDAEVQTQQLGARIGAGTSARILPGVFEEDCHQVVPWGLWNGDAERQMQHRRQPWGLV